MRRAFKISHRIAIDSCWLGVSISGIITFLPPRRNDVVVIHGCAFRRAVTKISSFVKLASRYKLFFSVNVNVVRLWTLQETEVFPSSSKYCSIFFLSSSKLASKILVAAPFFFHRVLNV